MKKLIKSALIAGIAMTATAAPLAFAPASAEVVKGIGVVNPQAVIASSTAYRTAQQQRQTTYKAQFDAAHARQQQAEAQIKPLVDQFNTARAAANPNQQQLQQQAAQIQQLQQTAQQDINTTLAPVALSEAYAEEMVLDQVSPAIQAAASKLGITLVLGPNTVAYADAAYNMNQAVLDELNRLLPSVAVTPPQGWLPREVREQQQARGAQAQGAAAAPAAPASQKPSGR